MSHLQKNIHAALFGIPELDRLELHTIAEKWAADKTARPSRFSDWPNLPL
ncbi:hypothetical protein HED55_14900 [Ochrobactrum haematophilum]|uniref:Uncharacterized protein n=1 Tax=Brucella haematophila TaxID=419474 RepID=A0ABX1DM63_9HYPH|nr:hypothetical protein [Brucella haematophila]